MKFYYKLIYHTLLLIMLFTLSGCTGSTETTPTENEEVTQSISTEYSLDTESFEQNSELEELESSELLTSTEEQIDETEHEISNSETSSNEHSKETIASENNDSESAQHEYKNESNNSNIDFSDENNSSGNESPSSNDASGSDTDNNNLPAENYHPADTNKDGWVSAEEEMHYITPEKQACIDAGYGVVVEMNGGEWYAVLMKSGDHTIDGKNGGAILIEHLNARGLDGSIGGCWINSDYEWYWFTAEDIYEPLTEEDEGFWN